MYFESGESWELYKIFSSKEKAEEYLEHEYRKDLYEILPMEVK